MLENQIIFRIRGSEDMMSLGAYFGIALRSLIHPDYCLSPRAIVTIAYGEIGSGKTPFFQGAGRLAIEKDEQEDELIKEREASNTLRSHGAFHRYFDLGGDIYPDGYNYRKLRSFKGECRFKPREKADGIGCDFIEHASVSHIAGAAFSIVIGNTATPYSRYLGVMDSFLCQLSTPSDPSVDLKFKAIAQNILRPQFKCVEELTRLHDSPAHADRIVSVAPTTDDKDILVAFAEFKRKVEKVFPQINPEPVTAHLSQFACPRAFGYPL
jgi:hypothetical protein